MLPSRACPSCGAASFYSPPAHTGPPHLSSPDPRPAQEQWPPGKSSSQPIRVLNFPVRCEGVVVKTPSVKTLRVRVKKPESRGGGLQTCGAAPALLRICSLR